MYFNKLNIDFILEFPPTAAESRCYWSCLSRVAGVWLTGQPLHSRGILFCVQGISGVQRSGVQQLGR